ncbi:MAG TPA: rod shape-determining protein RodA [Lachnospiraceae bacterium]|nr:FtsW/RodA/SpoVE family cell cycle protein [uncultured Lachnoclostridium sp.]HAU88202.1 rod shape-determining protein RodA [Lachnospiraceae bacterium]
MFQFKQYDWKKLNVSLIIVVTILCICSAVLVRCAADTQFKNSYFKGQIITMFAGLFVLAVVSLIDYHFICRFVPVYYVLGTIMVFATKHKPFGTDLGTGSWRWLKIGFNFQPSEIVKIILILTLAVYFERRLEKMDRFTTFIFGGIIMAIPTFFVMIQSDLSSSLVMVFIFAIMVYASGLDYKIVGSVLAISIPSAIALFWYIVYSGKGPLRGYQYDRIAAWLDPESYKLDEAYQQLHSIQSIGSGQLLGKLFTDPAAERHYSFYVDVTESDFIFTVMGEELGFIGCCVILALLAIVIIKCLRTAKAARDYQGRIIAIGIASMFMFQVFANVGVATLILPNTGLPLPFISRGLSSTLSSMIGIGMIINIGLQSRYGSRSGFSMSDYDQRGNY